MRRLQSLPCVWLVTDPRQGDALWPALARLPRGAGVLFREFERPPGERRALFARVRAVARRRRLVLVLAGDARTAAAWRAGGWHAAGGPSRAARALLRTAPAHDPAELARARAAGAALVFVSPVHPTRSHPGAPALGRVRFGLLIGRTRSDVVALGGMDARRARPVRRLGVARWAAIDGLTPDPPSRSGQKRKAVPT